MIVELNGVTKSFPEGEENQRREIISEFSLSIGSGESVSVVGPSGCGKSTLLNLIGTLDFPDSGEVKICGQQVNTLSDKGLANLRSDKIGFVFQLHHLLPQISVLENVMLPKLALHKPSSDEEARERAMQLLSRVGMEEHFRKRPSELSGGERQRVAVVRAMMNRPALLLADEPTGALDKARGDDLVDLLFELSLTDQTALVMVTHDTRTASKMNRNLIFEGTRIVEM